MQRKHQTNFSSAFLIGTFNNANNNKKLFFKRNKERRKKRHMATCSFMQSKKCNPLNSHLLKISFSFFFLILYGYRFPNVRKMSNIRCIYVAQVGKMQPETGYLTFSRLSCCCIQISAFTNTDSYKV